MDCAVSTHVQNLTLKYTILAENTPLNIEGFWLKHKLEFYDLNLPLNITVFVETNTMIFKEFR